MPTPVRRLPHWVNYAVIAAIGIPSVVAVLLLLAARISGFVVGVGFAAATYWFGYRNLNGDRATARMAVLVTGVVAAVFTALAALDLSPLGFVLEGTEAACWAMPTGSCGGWSSLLAWRRPTKRRRQLITAASRASCNCSTNCGMPAS